MAEHRRFDRRGLGCLEGLFNFLALNQKLQKPKTIAYRKHGEINDTAFRVKVPKPQNDTDKEDIVTKETNSVSPTAKPNMFIWKTLLFRKKTHKKDQKKNDSHSNSHPSSPPPSRLTRSSSPSSRLTRSSSIHHSKCFDYAVPDDLASEYQRMNDSSSNEIGSSHGARQSSRESPRGPIFQESCRARGSMSGKHILDTESSCETLPENVTSKNEVSSKQENRDDSTHQSKEFQDFLELFNAHRELFLKILHDPSLLVPPEQQEQEASSSGGVPMSKLESFPRPGGSSGKRNPIFDRSDSEKSKRAEIQRSPSRPKGELEGAKVISTRMPSGVEASTTSLVESRSLKKNGTTSNRFKAISKKIKDVVKDNRRELARITKDGIFHKMPYGQKMAELTKTTSTKKFVQEEKQIRRSYSIAESVDKYSTLYDSISRDSKTFSERPSTSTAKEDSASLYDKKSPMHMKRITSLPEMQLYSPHRDARIEVPDSRTIEPAHFFSRQNGSFNMYPEGNYYPDDIYSEQYDGESGYLGSLEEDLRSVLRTPSLCSFAQSFSHRRINSLPSFDRSFIQDHNYSFTRHSVADSEPTFEHMQLEDDEWLVKPSQLSGECASNSKDNEWLVRPLQPSCINDADHEDEEWVVETPHLLGGNSTEDEEWLVKPAQPSSADDLDSELRFVQEFADQNDSRSLRIYVNDKNEADFQYVKDILKKSGFSCGDADWYATNQPVSPVIFEEAECSSHDFDMAYDEPRSIDRRMLLFDIINEVLMHIYDSSLINGPWHSRFDPRTRPIPMGSHVLEEVWANVSCYLSLQWKPNHTVDDVVAYDIMRKDNWINLLYDVECVALDLEDLMLEDLLDDVVLQIVLISIDE